MRASMLLLVGVVLHSCTTALASFSPDVYQLTDGDFNAHVMKPGTGPWIVDFYAPWCGHCKKLIPEWSTLATNIKGVAKAASVDATSNKGVTNEYGVKGYPSIKIFLDDGKRVVDYKGVRDAPNLEKFVHKMLKPAVEELKSDADLTAFIKANPVAFVLLGSVSDAFDAALANASSAWQADTHFARLKSIPEAHSSDGLPGLAAYSDGELREVLSNSNPEGMTDFVEDNHLALLTELGHGTFFRTTHSGRQTVVALVDPYKDARTADIKIELRAMAKSAQYTKMYRFGFIDGVKWPEFCDQIGVSAAEFPMMVVIDAPKKLHYVHRNKTLTHATFLEAVGNGEVEAEGDGASWVAFLTPGPTGTMIAIGIVMVAVFFIMSQFEADSVPAKKSN